MNNIYDERIILEKNIISVTSYKILIYYLAIAVIYQKFFLNARFEQYAGEFFGLIMAVSYEVYGGVSKGINIDGHRGTRDILMASILTSLGSTFFLFFIAGISNPFELLKIFVLTAIVLFILRWGIHHLVRRKLKEIDEEFEKD